MSHTAIALVFAGGNLVTIGGSGFQAGVTTVRFGGNPATSVNVLSPSQLQARVPRGTGPFIGRTGGLDLRVNVTVENPGSATLPGAYTYQLPQVQR